MVVAPPFVVVGGELDLVRLFIIGILYTLFLLLLADAHYLYTVVRWHTLPFTTDLQIIDKK